MRTKNAKGETMTTMKTTISEIIEAKNNAGSSAYLWLQSTAGDCILWPTEESSVNDDGKNAVGRWQLTRDEENELIETGECDEVN